MDGINAVAARISEIRALVHPAPTVPRAAATGLGVTASPAAAPAHPFSAALSQAFGGPTASPPTAAPAFGLPTVPGSPAAVAAPTTALSVAALQDRFRNGKVPAEALTPIGGGHRLAAPAAAGFSQLRAAAQRDGVDIGVTDSYRSYEAQVDVARRKGLYSQGGLAAEPGTSSHGWGLAVDLDLDREALGWMRTNAARFGFVEDTPREPWHWAFQA